MTTRKPTQPVSHFAKRPGYSTLIAVLVTGAVGVTIVGALGFIGVSALKTGRTVQLATLARGYADACAEEALWQLRESVTYTGGTTLSFGAGTCEVIAVTGTGATNRVVQAEATVGTVVRRVEVDVAAVNPRMTLNDWQEVESF